MREVSWTTRDEIQAIDHIGSDKARDTGHVPTIEERISKLKVWIVTARVRRWDKGVNVDTCEEFAKTLLFTIKKAA